jgi:hypothetical protein
MNIIQKLTESISLIGAYGLGIFVGVICAQWLIGPTIKQLRKILKYEFPKRSLPPYQMTIPKIVGYIERALLLFLLPNYFVVGVWITLKVAPTWKEWTQVENTKVPGRATYNIFLIGSGLSILYSLLGSNIIQWGKNDKWEFVILSIPLAFIAHIILNIHLKNIIRPHEEN